MTQHEADAAEKIRLYRTPQGWMMQTSDPQVRELFGTDTLPTAFTAQALAGDVYYAIQQLNPTAAVDVWTGPVVGGIR
jgi:hypothetical protein